MNRLFGANWRTTVYGGLRSLLGAIVTGALTFPSDWHDSKQVALFTCVLIGTFFGFSFAVTAKDRDVTGGSKQQTVDGQRAEAGTQSLVDLTRQSPPRKQ